MSRVEQGTPWSFIQNVIQYYRPDLNNQQFYDWAGSNLDREYNGDWTNEENWPDYESTLPEEIEWDERDFSHRDSYEGEIQEELQSYKKDSKEKGLLDGIFNRIRQKFGETEGFYSVDGEIVDRSGFTEDGHYIGNPWGRRERRVTELLRNRDEALKREGMTLEESDSLFRTTEEEINRLRQTEPSEEEWNEANSFMTRLSEEISRRDDIDKQKSRLSPTEPIESNLPGSNKYQGGPGITVERKEMYDFIPLQKTKVTKTITQPTFPTNNEMPDQNQQSMTYEDKEEALRKLKSTQFRAPNVFA